MTCDGSLSFSNSLSCMISEYIQEKQTNHQLNQVGAHDFYSFVDSLYRDLYISQEADLNAIHQPVAVAGWASIMVSVWVIGGVQLMALGLIGEYVGKIYTEVKHRPRYILETYLDKPAGASGGGRGQGIDRQTQQTNNEEKA